MAELGEYGEADAGFFFEFFPGYVMLGKIGEQSVESDHRYSSNGLSRRSAISLRTDFFVYLRFFFRAM